MSAHGAFSGHFRPQSSLCHLIAAIIPVPAPYSSIKAGFCGKKQGSTFSAVPSWLTEQSLPAGVHFIMIGAYELQPQPAPYTSTNMLISATQIAWITADLAAVDRSVTPWIVAMFHPREPSPPTGEGKPSRVAYLPLSCRLHHAAYSTITEALQTLKQVALTLRHISIDLSGCLPWPSFWP